MHRPIVIAACLMAATASIRAQSPSDVNSSVARMVQAHNAWGEKISYLGAVLTLEEHARNGNLIDFRLRASGLPPGHVYSVVQWPVTAREPIQLLEGITFDQTGLAICPGKPGTSGEAATPDDPVDLWASPVAGEPLRMAVVAEDDSKILAAVKTVPIPLAATDRGCRLEAVLLTPHGELTLVEGTHFPPNAQLTFAGDSNGERHQANVKSDDTGAYTTAVMPAKAGDTNGTIKIRLTAPSCSPELSVPWGTKPEAKR